MQLGFTTLFSLCQDLRSGDYSGVNDVAVIHVANLHGGVRILLHCTYI